MENWVKTRDVKFFFCISASPRAIAEAGEFTAGNFPAIYVTLNRLILSGANSKSKGKNYVKRLMCVRISKQGKARTGTHSHTFTQT